MLVLKNKNKQKKKIPNCIAVLCTEQEKKKNSCTIQDYVYTIQVTLLNPLSPEKKEEKKMQ